jgi:hypothetical protein
MSTPCNARVLTKPYVIGGKTLYDTEECRKPATKHVWVDDADSRMYICGKCINRWTTKEQNPSKWYGWFDCETPPLTPAAESIFYMDLLRKEFGDLPVPQLRKKFLEFKNQSKQIILNDV